MLIKLLRATTLPEKKPSDRMIIAASVIIIGGKKLLIKFKATDRLNLSTLNANFPQRKSSEWIEVG